MFVLPELPYSEGALAPHLSAETIKLHHGKHHKAYVEKLNAALADKRYADLSLEEVIFRSHANTDDQIVFNNAAQCWNHDFLWKSMAPDSGGPATGKIGRLIDEAFGDAKAFEQAFTEAAVGHFGSGWIWLVLDDGKLAIKVTHDADLPLVHDQIALLTCDLWEHAYYVDYRNRRPDYVRAFLDHLVNWDFANENLVKARVSEPA